jgi:cell division protein ZapA
MESSKNSVHVNIYGEEYAIRCDGDQDYIRQVAGYLDRKMRDVAEKIPNKSPSKVAILAALNITDELFTERRKTETEVSSVEERTNSILSLLDDKLAKLPE